MDPFNNVYPTLLGCFGIILIGYVFGRLNLITQSQAKGLGSYISRVALPALLFKSLVALDFAKVSWDFWFGILLSKAVLFLIVAFLTLVTTRNDLGRAGLFGIFVTQSNDLALGLPLFDAIYGEVHPEYCLYLYLLVPVSVAFINPIGFLMLEFQKSATQKDNAESKLKLLLKALKSVISNPLVFMVILGLIVNAAFSYIGVNKEHWFLSPLLTVIGNSFGSTALFFLGLSLVGCTTDIGGFTLVVPFLLVICKSLIFPVFARQAVFWLCTNASVAANETSLTSFAFLYGTLPTAPPVAVYAAMYNSNVDTIGTSMVLGTFLSAPIMFVSSKMILVMNSSGADLENTFFKAFFDTGILSAICCVWVAAVMFTTKYYRKVLHQCTLALITCQLFLGVSTSLGKVEYGSLASKVISILFLIGLFGSTIWGALVSVALAMVRCKGEAFASKKRWIFLVVGLCCPIAVGIPLALLSDCKSERSNWLLKYIEASKPFNYCFGTLQVLVLVVCIGSLITLQRCDKYCRCRIKSNQSETDILLPTNENNRKDNNSSCKRCKTLCEKQKDVEDFSKDESSKPPTSRSIRANYGSNFSKGLQEDFGCSRTGDTNTLRGVISPIGDMDESQFVDLKSVEDLSMEQYLQGDSHQLTRHVILILCLCLFSTLSVFLCFERINCNMSAHNSGVYVEMEFLAVICIVGQGFVSFAIFGFNKVFFSFISFERFGCLQPWCCARKVKVIPSTQLDEKIVVLCQRFIAHHLGNCRTDLECDLRFYFKTYKKVFRGNQLVDWLIEFGLANTRMDAVYYGNCLLQGQIIEHCMNEHFFYDLPYFYRFCSEDPSSSRSTPSELK